MHICGKLSGILPLAGVSVRGTPSPSAQNPPSSRSSSASSLHTQCPATPERALPTTTTPSNPEHCSPILPILPALNVLLYIPQDLCTCCFQ